MIDLNDFIKKPRESNPKKMDTLYRCKCSSCGKDKGYKTKSSKDRLCYTCIAKNRSLSKETKLKISESIKSLPPMSKESRQRAGNKLKGRKLSIQHKQKLSCIKRGIDFSSFDDFTNTQVKRDRDLLYKKGISKLAYIRDNYICQCCNKKGKICAHHLNGFDKFPEQRFDLLNLITLCENCHKGFHASFGYKNNTKEQFLTFLNEVKRAN